MLNPGSKAPPVQLRGETGETHSLADTLGERGTTVLVFFKASCPTCQMTMPFVERLANGTDSRDVRFVAISQDDGATTQQFQREFGINMPVLLDAKESGYPASNGFAIEYVPSFFVVASDGIVKNAFEGFVKSELESLGSLAGVHPFREDEQVPELRPG